MQPSLTRTFTTRAHPTGLAALALLATLTTSALSATVRAQTPDTTSAFTVDAYDPGMLPTYDLLNLARSRVPKNLVPVLSLQLGYSDALLELASDADPRDIDGVLVAQRVRGDVVFGMGLLDRFALSLHLPFVVSQSGDDLALLDRPGETIPGAAFGDLHFALRAHIIRGGGFGVGLGVDLYLPTGNDQAFLSYGGFRLRPQLALDWHDNTGLGVVVNIGFQTVPETYAHNLVVDDGLTWGVGLDLPTPASGLHVLVSVFGTAPLSDGRDPADPNSPRDDGRTAPVELVGAFQYTLGDVVLALGGGAGLSRGVGAPSWRAFFEVAWSPHEDRDPERDGDGLVDNDRCPDVAEDFDGFQDADGCPDLDNDGDGIADLDDGSRDDAGFGSCRDLAEDRDGYFDDDGCPEPDNDDDKILDVDDGPRDATGFGSCRDAVEDLDGHEDGDGCPELDNDADGIPDTRDGPVDKGFGACRDAPESMNGYRDEDGCPDVAPKLVRVTPPLVIEQQVTFTFGKTTVDAAQRKVLDEVARIIKAKPEIATIEVQGHADHEGNNDVAVALSLERAQAVMKYLIGRGVPADRIFAKGYGDSMPRTLDDTAQGRASNRRVEFIVNL